MTVRDAVDDAVYTTLSGGTALIAALGGTAIYNLQAPDDAALPYVVYSHVGGGPDNSIGSDIYDMSYYVRVFAKRNVQARTIEKLFDALLHRQSLSVSGYDNFWTVRETDAPSTVENLPNKEKVYSSGGYYLIRLDA